MLKLRYAVQKDWPFYVLVIGYAYLVIRMTFGLWFGDGVNIFASYSEPASSTQILIDANKVYWSKTSYLFLTIILYTLNFDYRFAAGFAAGFWSSSLILMFGPTPTLVFTLVMSLVLIAQQIQRKQIFQTRALKAVQQMIVTR